MLQMYIIIILKYIMNIEKLRKKANLKNKQ